MIDYEKDSGVEQKRPELFAQVFQELQFSLGFLLVTLRPILLLIPCFVFRFRKFV